MDYLSVIYVELKEWQTALTGIAAVIAVIVAYNFNRKRDRQTREDEARSIAAALLGDLVIMRGNLILLAELCREATEKELSLTISQFPKLDLEVPSLLSSDGKLGLLPTELVISLTRFRFRFMACRLLTENEDPRGLIMVLDNAVSAFDDSEQLLRALEAYVGVERPIGPKIAEMLEGARALLEAHQHRTSEKGQGNEDR